VSTVNLEELFTRDDVRADVFMCRCGPEGVEQCEELMADVRRKLGIKGGRRINDDAFLSQVVFELNWSYHAYIDCIACDQWAMVSAKTHDGETEHPYRVVAMCDSVEDGIAAVYYGFATKPV
jgi:hypothetical protein